MNEVSKKEIISAIVAEAQYSIPLQGKLIHLERKRIPLSEITLDPTNQRIQFQFRSKDIPLTEEFIEEKMWDEDYVKDLANSIESNGGLLNPLLVTANGVVAEGNSRLVALRNLYKRYDKKKTIPDYILIPTCEVLPEKITRTELLWLLAEFHIAGKHEWNPYEQAEAIYTLHVKEKQPIEKIAQHLRMKRKTIQRKLDAYDLMTEYISTTGKGKVEKWSYFDELYKKPELVDRITEKSAGYEPEFKEKLFSWISSDKIKGEEMRRLDKVLAVPEASKILEEENFNAAYSKLLQVKPEESSPIFKTISQLINQIDCLTEKERELLMDSDHFAYDERVKLLSKLSDKVVKLVSVLGIQSNLEDEVASG